MLHVQVFSKHAHKTQEAPSKLFLLEQSMKGASDSEAPSMEIASGALK